jgi:hypothetical protein
MSKTNYWARAFPAALSSAALLHAAPAPRTAEFTAGMQAYAQKSIQRPFNI